MPTIAHVQKLFSLYTIFNWVLVGGVGALMLVILTIWIPFINILSLVLLPLGWLALMAGAIGSVICGLWLVYAGWKLLVTTKGWKGTTAGGARLTPLEAVFGMLIGLFNYYWVFVAIKGLYEELKALLASRALPSMPIGDGQVLATCILFIVGTVGAGLPLLGQAALIAFCILAWQFFGALTQGIVTLLQAGPGTPPPMPSAGDPAVR